MAQKEKEEREDKVKKRKEYEELMSLRTDSEKNKIRKHLKVTKSANKSVLDDAVNKTDTAVTMQGPEQPDEDDYGYTSNEAGALYKSLMDKYKSIPEDKKFSKSSLGGSRNGDLMSTKDRVRAAIIKEKEDEKLGRKRSHSSTTTSSDSHSSSMDDPKHRSRKNLYDPRAEREAEERRKREQDDEKRQKMRNKRPPPPVMDFQKLLKLAEEKQHQPIQVEVPQKQKEPERLLTSKEKKELEIRKAELEERERRRHGLPSKSQTNGDNRKTESSLTNGRIPKLNGSNPSSSKVQPSSSSSSQSAVDSRRASNPTFKVPARPAPSMSSNKTPQKSQPSSNGSIKPIAPKTTNVPQSNGKRPVDLKSKSQPHDTQRSLPKPNSVSKPLSKPIDSKNVKPREFPPRDLAKPREFPPRDLIKSREFPPRDVQRGYSSMKQKQTAASKRRILDDSDEEEYDSEMDDFIDDDEPELDYSSEIRKMFGYDKSRYRDDDDDVDNMESSFAQQQREEFISKKIGIMEDLEGECLCSLLLATLMKFQSNLI